MKKTTMLMLMLMLTMTLMMMMMIVVCGLTAQPYQICRKCKAQPIALVAGCQQHFKAAWRLGMSLGQLGQPALAWLGLALPG